jgi:tRNA (Thr-GGU) A37 N-methylase
LGGSQSSIVLQGSCEETALDGVEAFTHVEVIFVFDRVAPESVVTDALFQNKDGVKHNTTVGTALR